MTLEKIGTCFGIVDGIFAGHPSDEERALELLNECYKKNISLANVIDEAEKYLLTKTSNAEFIQEQLEKISKKYSPWIE